MDFSGLLVIGLSAIVSCAWTIFAEFTSRRVSIFQAPVIVAYLLSIVVMLPWQIASVEDATIVGLMLFFMAIWVIIGWVAGALPTSLLFSLIRWAKGCLGKGI